MEKIFEPRERRELLKGWLIHDRKGWKEHGEAARRVAAVSYKSSLKEIEALLATAGPNIDDSTVQRIEKAFQDLERSAPVVPTDIDAAIERSHETFEFIQEAADLGTHAPPRQG